MHSLDVGDPAGLLTIIAAQLGHSLVEWRATHSEPARRGDLLGFDGELESADGHRQSQTIFVETESAEEPRDNVLVLEDPRKGSRIAVWVYPYDPSLPALASTVFSESASLVLARLGIEVTAPQLSVLAYRPGKRAVVRVDGGTERVYLKVVRPGRAAAIVDRHSALLAAGIEVPRVIGWSKDGLIALTELVGVEAQKIPLALDEGFLGRVRELSAQLATARIDAPARESLADRLSWYQDRLIDRMPEQKRRFRTLTDDIRQLLSEGRANEVSLVTIHGDLHAGQIFVHTPPDAQSQVISGLLDIDTAGLGDPADDAAAFYAHLLVLAQHNDDAHRADAAEHIRGLARAWRQEWVRDGDPGFSARARAISATHFLGHALRQSSPDATEAMIRLATTVAR